MNYDPDEVCSRLREELLKISSKQAVIARKLGCSTAVVSLWFSGKSTPTAYYLTAMHEAGVDITYIITGKRGGPDTDV